MMHSKIKRLYLPKIKLILLVAALGLVFFGAVKAIGWERRFVRDTGLSPGIILRLVFNSGADLEQSDGRTNILLLGIGGGTHAGADLTDTIIVVSVDQSKHTMALISVPRDIWSDTLKDKVNSAYHYGEAKKTGGGFILAKAVIEDVIGVPIHYAFMIDFTGFQDLIDLVGGVKVTVPEAFTDTEFPIVGRENDPCGGDPQLACRYESVHFDAGVQLMNGDRALKYVRSRHATGTEGGDFARSRRQQDVLVAFKAKLIDPGLWLSVNRMRTLLRAIDKATDTDMNFGELATIGKFMLGISSDRIQKISIDKFLVVPPSWLYGRYVLIPQENFASIHTFIKSQLP